MLYAKNMSLASNLISNIVSAPSDMKSGLAAVINLNDKTFAEILEKQLKVQSAESISNFVGSMGIPAGMEIQDLTDSELNNLKSTEKISSSTKTELFDYSRRQAVNFYNRYSKNVVMGLREFMGGAFNSN